jgi:AcrR family transcriptional regulator
MRADARRNYEKLLAAAAEAFGATGTDTSLEAIARTAGVGIGTLYRHFPTREALLEAVYVEEVEEMARSAEELGGLEPWDALATWLRRYVDFSRTKRAIGAELLASMDAPVFLTCRTALVGAGEGLVQRAQDAGVVRPDASFMEIVRMVGGIAAIPNVEPDEVDRILGIALDGLRYGAAAGG